jgi:hypothetical protein
MKVILIAYHFPPDPSVGSIRAGKVAAALVRAGFEVHVIAGRLSNAVGAELPGAVVHRVRALPNAREIAAFFRTMAVAPGRNGTAVASRDGGIVARRDATRWKRTILSLLFVPDDRAGFIISAAVRAARFGRQPGTLFYTSGPPFSVHVAGWIARRLTGGRWFAEFRDPWVVSDRPESIRSEPAERATAWLRRRCIRAADGMVAVSRSLSEALTAERAAVGRSPVITVLNGIDLHPAPNRIEPADECRISYFGHLYHGRDPRPFLSALARLRTAGRLRPGVALHFYGECRDYHGVSVAGFAVARGVGDLIHFHDEVRGPDYIAAMSRSQLLLLFAQNQPKQIPNKLYDYLGVRRPIFGLVDAGGETARMLTDLGEHHVVVTDDEAAIADALVLALRDLPPGQRPVPDLLLDWSTENQMSKLVGYLLATAGAQP